jgi:hypothetical protein
MRRIVNFIIHGRVFYFPVYFLLIFLGVIINTYSVHGLNGHATHWQTSSTIPAYVGGFLIGMGIPGFLFFLYILFVVPIIKLFRK